MWSMGLLFIKTSPVKQYSYPNDLSGASDAKFSVTFVKYSHGTEISDYSLIRTTGGAEDQTIDP